MTLKKIHYTWHKNDDPSIKLYLSGGINKSNKRTININDFQSLKVAKVFLEKTKTPSPHLTFMSERTALNTI